MAKNVINVSPSGTSAGGNRRKQQDIAFVANYMNTTKKTTLKQAAAVSHY